MAQQVPAGFVPDGFVPDEESPEGFVPDGFVPDAETAKSKLPYEGIVFQRSPSGQITQTAADYDPNRERRDRSIFSAISPEEVDRRYNALGYAATDAIAQSEYIPEFLKPSLAAVSEFARHPLRILAHIATNPQPEDILLPGLIRPRTPRGLPVSGAEVVERLPETRPERLLPAPVDPYIASETGQIQRRSLLTPQEEARLAGYDFTPEGPAGFPGEPAPRLVDLDELREAERLKNIFFTKVEQEGGTRLDIPDRPFIDAPPIAGETRLGFEPVSRGDLPYPLNVVPEAVRPRSAQEVTRALAGDEFARPISQAEPVTFESAPIVRENPIPPTRDLRGGTAAIEADEIIYPSTPKGPRKTDTVKTPATQAVRTKVKADTGIDPQRAAATVAKSPEPIKKSFFNWMKNSDNPAIAMKSIYTQISELGKSGRELMFKFQRAAQNRSEYDAIWTEPLFESGAKLRKNEFDNFGAYVEGRLPIPSARVQEAVDAWKQSQTAMADTATAQGLHLKRGGETIPFERVSGEYWPHVPAENLTKKDIVTRLVDNGMTRHDALNVAKRWEATGEIFLRGQHSRLKDSFKYRDDFDVAIAHGRAMAKRISNHQNLGPKDVAGKGLEGVADLIEDTSKPDLAVVLAKRLAGRDKIPTKELVDGLNKTKQAAFLSSLPNFSIPNVILGQLTNAHMVALSRHPVEAVKEITKLFRKTYRDEIRAAGVFNSFNQSLLEEVGGKRFDPFLIGAGEKINRAVAAAIGKTTIREAVKDYKAGVNTKAARYFIETLLSRNADEVTEVTPEMERFAAGRMAEITQGLNNPGNFPYHWSHPVNDYLTFAGQLVLIFKKVGFQVTKTVKDTIKADPAVAIPSWLILSQIAGELVGDVKSVITGRERPEDIERIPDNWGNAFMLGLPWELATSGQYGPASAVASTAGPVASKVSEALFSAWETGERLGSGAEDPLAPLRRFGAKNLPVPGRERIRQMLEED